MNIKVGDLCMIAKASPCCGNTESIGKVLVAEEIVADKEGTCVCCGNRAIRTAVIFDYVFPVMIERLIKIDPPALPMSIDIEKEVTA